MLTPAAYLSGGKASGELRVLTPLKAKRQPGGLSNSMRHPV